MRDIPILLLCSFALSLLLCAAEIPLLKKLKAGQNILQYVKEHKDKSGTPTMGGLGFILAAAVVALAFCGVSDRPFAVCIAVGVGYLFVGFLDDLIKKKRGKNLGLRPYQKLFFQFAVAVIAGVYAVLGGMTLLYIPYTKIVVDIGWWMLPLGVFVFLATVNSVNLTDGLDGLAGSSCAFFFLILGILLRLEGTGDMSSLCFCLTGALAAYLVFNTSRASVFMGDTGSLSLGGFAASVALFSGNALAIPILGAVFVLSSISVIIQVIHYKRTGRRVFLMAPIHHHFQEKGFSEAKISYGYAISTAALGLTLLLPFA